MISLLCINSNNVNNMNTVEIVKILTNLNLQHSLCRTLDVNNCYIMQGCTTIQIANRQMPDGKSKNK